MSDQPMPNGFADHSGLPATADVVVIGGGVNGASTAFQLAKRGQKVVLLERDQLGAGATGKSGALVRCHYANTHEAKLTLESLKVFRKWDDLVGHGSPGFETPGFLQIVAPEYESRLRANAAALRAVGVETTVVSAREAKEIEPLLNVDDLSYVAFEPHSGYADPNGTVYGFAAAARAHGANVRTQTRVTRIVTERDEVIGVDTNRGHVSTKSVVLVGGAWANDLLHPLGVDLGLVPRRIQVIVFRWPASVAVRRPHRVIIDATQRSWFRPEGARSTIIGVERGGRDQNAAGYTEAPDAHYVDTARQALTARFPAFAHATMRGGWAGMIMNSPDGHPIISQIPSVAGLFVMAGDSGTSFKTSPAIGICLAELITEGASKLVDLTPFRSTRFAEGEPWHDEHGYSREDEVLTVSR